MLGYLSLIILGGTVITALTARYRKLCGYLSLICVLLINVIIFKIGITIFKTGTPLIISEPIFSIPAIGAGLTISIDKLSVLFMFLIGIIAFLATLYSIDYMDIYKEENLVRYYPFLILFIGGMIGVVSVSDFFFFFVFWEFMTLVSYVLVIYEKGDRVVLRAGFKYFLMTHIGTAAMFFSGIILQAQTGSFNFANIEQAINTLSTTNPALLHIVLALFFYGFATKAGVYPFGTWLPDAHPAAPSGVSAMLSGIMIKMGIYGILRVFLFMIPLSNTILIPWGIAISTFGVISIIMGTISALVQKDYKRLLAYHSIGQVGYILLGIGVGITFLKDNIFISSIAVIAGLLHLVNHAFFKGLLFLNAGSILYKTGTRNLNETGGLSSIMPLTALTAIVASMSISGFPMFSGFVSKWLIYEVSIIGGIKLPLFILYGVLAIFISLFTLASFIKFFSSSFLGSMPTALKNKLEKKDVPMSMSIPQVILAIICIYIGLMPLTPINYIYATLSNSKLGSALPGFESLFGPGMNGISIIQDGGMIGIFRPLFIFLIFIMCFILAFFIFKAGRAKKRTVPVWYCGEEYEPDQVRYRAHGFYLPLTSIFEKWLTAPTMVSIKRPERVYRILDFDRTFYYPLVRGILSFTKKLRRTHVGIPQVYMLWQVIGIILVILILFLFAK